MQITMQYFWLRKYLCEKRKKIYSVNDNSNMIIQQDFNQ